jgi:tetratricopeptide (TPR) repeat protein
MRMGIDGLEGAWRDWKELAGLEPDDLEVCENIAFAWILRRCRGTQAPAEAAAGDAELALRSAEKDWRARAENRSSRRNLGAVLYHLGRLEEARSHLEGAWLADRRLYSAALHLAMIAHRGGEPKKARALFDTATAEGPGALGPGTAGREFLECMRTSAERVLQEPTGVSPTR